ncbi:hypothetical protein GCM10009087_22200 [Sphingomonas oligophenolica]|uniref:DUF6311 domain-containing protein n=1 Tax=Sphingomonas oligophenolica TaxID=301154 RepID=A0ABU9Y1X5_9SPHN
MRRAIHCLLLALIPAAIFLALFHPAILDIGNAGWVLRGADLGENALGMHAWLHDQAAGWSPRTSLLNTPEGTSLLFTDSNPLLGLLAKPFAPLLPADTQLLGAWLLTCCFLQALFAWALLRRHAPGFAALWCGVALLCVLPTWFHRYVHPNLFAHWMILCALWIFADPKRATRLRWWVPLIAIAALVHVYLLLMVAAIWASALFQGFAAVRGAAARRERLRIAGGAVVVLVMVALLGVLHGGGGSFVVTDSYGAFAMPLDALWNPANPGYHTILPAIPQREGRGYEGFQYLGVGILLLLGAAFVIARRFPPAPSEGDVLRRLRWLLPAYAVLLLLAISNFPDIAGHRLPRLPLPGALAPLLDLVRASGRLFWPIAYTLVLIAILAVYRLGKKRAATVLAILLLVQAIDIAPMAGVVRAQTAEADRHRLYVRTLDPRWQPAIAAAHDITFEPADPMLDRQLFEEVAWRAVSIGKPLRVSTTSRIDTRTAARLAGEHARFLAGDLDPRRLYVLLPGAAAPPTARGRVIMLDGTWIILPAAPPQKTAVH